MYRLYLNLKQLLSNRELIMIRLLFIVPHAGLTPGHQGDSRPVDVSDQRQRDLHGRQAVRHSPRGSGVPVGPQH